MIPSDFNSDDLRRIKPIVDDVFDNADPSQAFGGQLDSDEEICPLFCAISNIEQRYEDHHLIGRGGMKEVYRVYDAKASRHCALDKLLPVYSKDHFDAFLREAHLTARLDHPNIIDLFDMDVDQEGRPFFTMELKQGRSLREVVRSLQEKPHDEFSSLNRRLEVFLRVCDAIAYAHSRRVLHLDIKPENIFVGEFGEVKVCDWGMGVVMLRDEGGDESSVLLDPDLYGALLESAKGTPAYMAPEQMDRRQLKTCQMDVYSMGCLLNELVTLKQLSRSPAVDSNVDLALAAIIAKSTNPDPASRYEKVEELGKDISLYLNGYRTSVERIGVLREAALFYRRHREACSIAVGLLFALAMSITFLWSSCVRVVNRPLTHSCNRRELLLLPSKRKIARSFRLRSTLLRKRPRKNVNPYMLARLSVTPSLLPM